MKRILIKTALFVIIFAGAVLVFNYINNIGNVEQSVENTRPELDKVYAGENGQPLNEIQGMTDIIDTSLTRDSIMPVGTDKKVEILLPMRDAGIKVKYMLRDFAGENLIEDGVMKCTGQQGNYAVYETSLRMNLDDNTEYRFYACIPENEAKSGTDDEAVSGVNSATSADSAASANSAISVNSENDAKSTVVNEINTPSDVETTSDASKNFIYYGMRVKTMENPRLNDFLSYAEGFHNAALDGNETMMASVSDAVEGNGTQIVEIATGMDAVVSTGDGNRDASLFHVTLKSTYDALIYGGLKMQVLSEPIPKIRELSENSAQVELRFKTKSSEDGDNIYSVTEEFQLHYNEEKGSVEMTGYDRTLSENFNTKNVVSDNKMISLGIVDPDSVEKTEDSSGIRTAFTSNHSVWLFDSKTGYISCVYGSNREESETEKSEAENFGIRLLSLSSKTLQFAVYGRVSEGKREGQNGISLYNYSISDGTLQELVFIKTKMSYEELSLSAGRFMYFSPSKNTFYTLLGNGIMAVNVHSGKVSRLVKDMPEDLIYVSDDMTKIAYPDSENLGNVTKIYMHDFKKDADENFENGSRKISIIKFIGNNLLYGEAEDKNIKNMADGSSVFDYSALNIVSSDGKIIKKYEKSGYLVSGLKIDDGKISLTRVKADDNGTYTDDADDYISYLPEESTDKITFSTDEDDKGIEKTSLKFSDSVYLESRTDEILTKVIDNPSEKELSVNDALSADNVYMYSGTGLAGEYRTDGAAVIDAEESDGFVTNSEGVKIYEKHDVRNFYSAGGTFDYVKADGLEKTLDACTEMAIASAGGSMDGTNISDNGGWKKTFQKYGNGTRGMVLAGVKLDTAISFLSDGAPFVVRQSDRYVIVFSYNADFIRYYDPVQNKEIKTARNTFEDECSKNGNEFYVWQK